MSELELAYCDRENLFSSAVHCVDVFKCTLRTVQPSASLMAG